MLYVNLPSPQEFSALNQARADAAVSIYLETTPLTQQIDVSRKQLSNLYNTARRQLEDAGFDKRRLAELDERISDFLDEDEDEEFWAYQANSLGVLITPDSIRTFRLANKLSPMVMVSDRFHLTPLLRAITFPNTALVLAASENAVRLIEVFPDMAPSEVRVPELPRDAASSARKSSLKDRAPVGRIQGAEGKNVRLRQYARRIDSALRPRLVGTDTPLILAASDRFCSIYRSVNSYTGLLDDDINTTTDRSPLNELAAAAREILDSKNKRDIDAFAKRYQQRLTANRATSDLSDAARAATFGAIDTLLVDIDCDVPGKIHDETGALTLAREADASTYDVVDEIAARALVSGARVLGVRKADLPEDGALAAILRYAL